GDGAGPAALPRRALSPPGLRARGCGRLARASASLPRAEHEREDDARGGAGAGGGHVLLRRVRRTGQPGARASLPAGALDPARGGRRGEAEELIAALLTTPADR